MVDHRDFDQASALISRLLEGVGGSADAYAAPVAPSVPTEATTFNSEPLPCDDGICVDGEAQAPEDGRDWWINPDPVTDDYEVVGAVEDSAELKVIWEAIHDSFYEDVPKSVKLDTGTYQTEKQTGGTWLLKDTVKDRLYCQEHVHGVYSIVDPDDIFIWVLSLSNRDADLGYMHEGWVFLHK